MSDIVQRLRRKTVAGQPVFPTPLDIEAANEIERLRARVGRDVGDFDYPPGSAPCMCYFSTAIGSGLDPIGKCDYHAALHKRLAETEALLRELRQRTQNLLHRQHGDNIIMNPDEYLRATLSFIDAFLAREQK